MQDYSDNLSQVIERYILGLFQNEEDENFISLRRKELAEMFGCVPSQINYVLRSRFGPERGYLIESRRGEYGYIKILRITYDEPKEKSKHINDIIGDEISLHDACRLLEVLKERSFITDRERLLIEIALRNESSNKTPRKTARLFKRLLKSLMSSEISEENFIDN
ncbi:MAG: CtsR family transcriptional regulator [Synergistales bacterium]|nr:CtsR family transcriptional regulator [Synergistaceae bacterium]MDY6399910.1 CtsR family transcriptional regulator [Synergistales bacterium]MDY6401891.1 CtsR family transcriptional regulator [Synergistales bacterium]MDY6403905.1 CtsR family transcriptional regulator [Synergistales bacterium]MDY6411297.1 CtsR family transcriptional regulator [Synergistales bacterium]